MSTVGQSIKQSETIARAVDSIVAEIDQKTSSITDVRPPSSDLKASYDELVKSAGDSRGRALMYPCLGSGAGRGALIELADGSVKWDMIAGVGVHFFGHSHPEILRAQIRSGLEDATKHGNLMSGTIPYDFARKLIALASRKSRLKHAFLTTSGVMANESALKVCMQKHAPATRVIAFKNCFMGRSITMTSIGDSAAARVGIPVNQAVDYMPFWSDAMAEHLGGPQKLIDFAKAQLLEYIERFPKQHACFIFELVQGEGGFNTAPRQYFVELMDICRQHGIAIWCDEIQTFGRTTEMFAFETYDLGSYVDVFCVGKLTQACAAMFTEEYNPQPGLLSGTFSGATVDFEVGLKILEMLEGGSYYGEDGLFARHYAAFRQQAEALIAKHPEWFPKVADAPELVGGIGGMMRLTPFGGKKDKVMAAAKALFDEGMILFWCGHGPYHLRMSPLPAVRLEDWPRIFAVLESVGSHRVA